MNRLFIKNMVCQRCIAAVKQEFNKVGLEPASLTLGEVALTELPSDEQLQQLDAGLHALGFERIDDRKARIIEAVKNKIIQLIHHSKEIDRKHNWSTILAEHVHYEYNYLSNLFSSVEGLTLEQYIIRQKIEKAKELLFYDELNLSEIASQLGYSSVAHLSAQFKKVTGMTPSALKKNRRSNGARKALDDL
jgi:AraC family transcriptional regulator